MAVKCMEQYISQQKISEADKEKMKQNHKQWLRRLFRALSNDFVSVENILKKIRFYKKFGVRVRAKKNILTGDIDKSTLVLVELMDYQPKFDEDYLQGLIRKATPKWRGVNAGEWLANVRGGLA